MAEYINVTTLNLLAKQVLEQCEPLNNLIVCGEVSNFTRHYKSGHCYFTLKDENAAIKCVMFRDKARLLGFAPENGMLVDSSQLGNIVALGEVQGTEHIDSSHIERSEAVKAEFLAMHGYDSVPQGYEVHHIVPLSEGGADDVHNMILLSEHDHDIVTHAHKEFYGWDTPW